MHRFYRLLRISRTTARTRARLTRSQRRRMKARGRGVSQGWALSETQQRVQVRGCSPAEKFRELGSGLHDVLSLARIADGRMGVRGDP
jgi:hypothetical protein